MSNDHDVPSHVPKLFSAVRWLDEWTACQRHDFPKTAAFQGLFNDCLRSFQGENMRKYEKMIENVKCIQMSVSLFHLLPFRTLPFTSSTAFIIKRRHSKVMLMSCATGSTWINPKKIITSWDYHRYTMVIPWSPLRSVRSGTWLTGLTIDLFTSFFWRDDSAATS